MVSSVGIILLIIEDKNKELPLVLKGFFARPNKTNVVLLFGGDQTASEQNELA
jgi:hypothetical protein